MRLLKTHHIEGEILLLSGLHIGAGKDTIEIGGIDNPVIKDPYTGFPYIPGSSLKGKMRCLLEWAYQVVEENGSVYGSNAKRKYPDHPILRVFGTTHKDWDKGPTRLLVRDAHLTDKWKNHLRDRGLPPTEEKTEVVIDRIQGKAKDRIGPRKTERVPAGAVFKFEMIYRIFEIDGDAGKTDEENLRLIWEGMKLIEQDTLGGSGSRGYGRIEFRNLRLDDNPTDEKDNIREIKPWEPCEP